jgi:hypothetical protein
MLGVEIEFGNDRILSETSSYRPRNAKTPLRTLGLHNISASLVLHRLPEPLLGDSLTRFLIKTRVVHNVSPKDLERHRRLGCPSRIRRSGLQVPVQKALTLQDSAWPE